MITAWSKHLNNAIHHNRGLYVKVLEKKGRIYFFPPTVYAVRGSLLTEIFLFIYSERGRMPEAPEHRREKNSKESVIYGTIDFAYRPRFHCRS